METREEVGDHILVCSNTIFSNCPHPTKQLSTTGVDPLERRVLVMMAKEATFSLITIQFPHF